MLINVELAIENKQSEERKTIKVARATRVGVRTSEANYMTLRHNKVNRGRAIRIIW